MRFKCPPTFYARRHRKILKQADKLSRWHDYFVWLPTRIDNDEGEEVCVWFETVNRCYPGAELLEASIRDRGPYLWRGVVKYTLKSS